MVAVYQLGALRAKRPKLDWHRSKKSRHSIGTLCQGSHRSWPNYVRLLIPAQVVSTTGSTWPTAPTATSWSSARPSTCRSRSSTRSSGSRTSSTGSGRPTRSTWSRTGNRSSAEATAAFPAMPTDAVMAERPQKPGWLIQKVRRNN